MGYNKSPLALEDVRVVLDRAVQVPIGLRVPFATRGEAVYWRSRANLLRRMDRQDNMTIYPRDHELHRQSIYDGLRFILEGSTIIIRKISRTIPETEELME